MFNVYNIFEIIIIKDMDNLNVKKYEEVLKKNEVELQKKLGEFKNITDMGSDTEGELLEEEADEAEELVKKYEEVLKKNEVELQKKLGEFKNITDMGSDTEGELLEEEADEAEELVINAGQKQILKERLADVQGA